MILAPLSIVSCGKLFDHSLQKLKNERAQARKVFIILGRYQLPPSFHSFAFWKQTNKQKREEEIRLIQETVGWSVI